MFDILKANLLSPIPLAFALGIFARLVKSEFSLPKDIYSALSIYLLFALGLKGGVELSHATFEAIVAPAGVTLLLGCITPITAFAVMRYVGRFNASDSAGMAAHYGSVSAVTFIAAQQFMQRVGAPAEGFMPTLLTLLESPGIHIALFIGAVQRNKALAAAGGEAAAHDSLKAVLHEVLT
ncbi:MAG: sodium-dependent bicarbonate transport family permease, partial [Gemmatimonadaceae bacterium]|nr:sodium-dependent bicarbonate transport family permease [Gemmatimonadaceae bacterium]